MNEVTDQPNPGFTIPSAEEQAELAKQAIALYDRINAMCDERKACPEPFASIYSELTRQRFELERKALQR